MRPILIACAAAIAAPALAQTSTPPAPPPADICARPERSQLDFWVGHWDVYPTGTSTLIAHSLIEKLYSGCAIRENWMPLGAPGGGSLSAWNPKTGKWHQTWVDSTGGTTMYDGGMVGDTMTLDGIAPSAFGPGKEGMVRMRYRRNADGSVRQWGEVSPDNGKSWAPRYDLTYKPSAS